MRMRVEKTLSLVMNPNAEWWTASKGWNWPPAHKQHPRSAVQTWKLLHQIFFGHKWRIVQFIPKKKAHFHPQFLSCTGDDEGRVYKWLSQGCWKYQCSVQAQKKSYRCSMWNQTESDWDPRNVGLGFWFAEVAWRHLPHWNCIMLYFIDWNESMLKGVRGQGQLHHRHQGAGRLSSSCWRAC